MNAKSLRLSASVLNALILPFLASVVSNAGALTVLSGPTLAGSANAPLAARFAVTADLPCRVSITVDDGIETWQRKFYDYRTAHSLVLLGFKPDRTNQIVVTLHDSDGQTVSAPEPLTFITSPLPAAFPPYVVKVSQPEKMEPGYTLFRAINQLNNRAFTIMMDATGQVVWYSGIPSNFGIRQLANGNLLFPFTTFFNEVDLMGTTVRTWPLPAAFPYHHDAYETDHGTFLWLTHASRVVSGFPTTATNASAPTATTNVWHTPVVETSMETGGTLHLWEPIDILNPRRVTYMTFTARSSYGWDWSHANAVIEDKRDNSLILSMRHQNAVIKFARDTGELIWILGAHENWGPELEPYLLKPVGAPFEWQYGQHAPMITPHGTLLLFDNGNLRANPFNPPVADDLNFSRSVEYDIDEERMEVRQVWEYGQNAAERIYAPSRGDANWLPKKGNVLMTFADAQFANGIPTSTNSPNARMLRLIEVTHPKPTQGGRWKGRHDDRCHPGENEPSEVVMDLAFYDFSNNTATYRGVTGYRADRIPDFYVVTTPADSLAQLLLAVNEADMKCQWRLAATLRAAAAVMDRYPLMAVVLLKVFQHKVAEQMSSDEPELAAQLDLQAQSIVDALRDGRPMWGCTKMCSRFNLRMRHRGARPCLEFSADQARVYIVEASTDLVNWRRMGAAKHKGNGAFDFEDPESNQHATRFYRVRTP